MILQCKHQSSCELILFDFSDQRIRTQNPIFPRFHKHNFSIIINFDENAHLAPIKATIKEEVNTKNSILSMNSTRTCVPSTSPNSWESYTSASVRMHKSKRPSVKFFGGDSTFISSTWRKLLKRSGCSRIKDNNRVSFSKFRLF